MKRKGAVLARFHILLLGMLLSGCFLDEPIHRPTPVANTNSTKQIISVPNPRSTSQVNKPAVAQTPTILRTHTASKDSPCAFIKGYFQSINNRDYTKTWNLLSEHYRNDYHDDKYKSYEDWWNTAENIQVPSCKVEQTASGQSQVKVEIVVDYFNGARGTSKILYELVMDDARNTWLIDEGYVTEGDSQDSRNPSVTRVPFQPYSAISNCAKARVRIGDIVMLENDVDNLFIRSSSDNHPSSNIIGYFKPGQKAKVISGPECSWGWMMWRIQRLNDGFEGWVAESDGKEFWLKLEG